MLIQKEKRLRDRQYLDSYRDAECIVCGGSGDVVGAHIRTGNEGGMGLKPSDNLTLPLCSRCHADQEANPGPHWWLEEVVKRMARNRYWEWKHDNG